MPIFFDLDEKPWCTGRDWPNGPPLFRSKSIGRVAPHYWIMRISNLSPDPAGRNGDHVLSPYFVQDGNNPGFGWGKTDTLLPSPNLVFAYLPYPADPTKHFFRVTLQYGTAVSQAKIYECCPVDYIDDWGTRDGITFVTPVSTGINWAWGNPVVQMLIGKYSRLPAHSCRGDFKGEWP